jgi:hypothetical protein
MKKACEEMDRLREKNAKLYPGPDVGVDLIREKGTPALESRRHVMILTFSPRHSIINHGNRVFTPAEQARSPGDAGTPRAETRQRGRWRSPSGNLAGWYRLRPVTTAYVSASKAGRHDDKIGHRRTYED